MSQKVIHLLVVDDHRLLREGLTALIRQETDIEVIGVAADGPTSVSEAQRLTPEVVLMDLSLPGMNGIDATRAIVNTNPAIKVLALSARNDLNSVRSAFDAGASGYLAKDCAHVELIEAIRAVADRQLYYGTSLTYLLRSKVTETEDNALTPREHEVFQLIADGHSIKQAAIKLHISSKTVETHRRSLMSKLNVHSVVEMTKLAIRKGLVRID